MDTLYTLELDCYPSNPKMYVYAQGVSVFLIRFDYHTNFRIKKHWLDHYELKKAELTYYFLLLQRTVKKHLLRRRRAFRLLPLRQTGQISPRQFFYLLNRPE
jgi:hypothetical protein